MTTMRERFMKIGEGSVRFISTREDVLNFIEQEIKLAVKEERERIVGIIKSNKETLIYENIIMPPSKSMKDIIEYINKVEE